MEQIEVRILDRNFKLQVPAQERERLMRAVQIVDRKMREIRDAGRAQGTDRIAVNAALQLVYEFLGREAAAESAVGSDSDPAAGTSAMLSEADTADEVAVAPATNKDDATDAGVTAPQSTPVRSKTGHSAPTRPATGARNEAARPDAQATTRGGATRPAGAKHDASKHDATRHDAGKTDSAGAGAAAGKPPIDARIEEISNELEAEIRRQESLF